VRSLAGVAVQLAHTAEVDQATLDVARALLHDAFAGEFSDHDWEHALGGLHALMWEGDELVGHGSIVQRRLLYRGRALRTGYVEAVGVRPDRRGRGHAGAIMEQLERVAAGAHELGALSATDAGARLYVSRGWQRWEGPTSVVAPVGIVRTEGDDGSVYVFSPDAQLDLTCDLACDWREGDVW
jgi:aminoglycoside 2'-N-acetyltransferase I